MKLVPGVYCDDSDDDDDVDGVPMDAPDAGVHAHPLIHTRALTHTHTRALTHTHTHSHSHTHTHTHTHTEGSVWSLC